MRPNVLVVGLGRSGIGAAKLLNAEGYHVIVIESQKEDKFKSAIQELNKLGIDVELSTPFQTKSLAPWLSQLNKVVVSPGVPWDHPTLNVLRHQGISIQGEMAVAWQRLKDIPWIGVTGTNGKSTVTHFLNHVLESNGINAPMGGNVGFSATELALNVQEEKRRRPEWLIMELSSYQIEAAPEVSPLIGIWTNLTPDHLERHKTLDKYREIKRSLLDRSQIRIYNADDPDLKHQRNNLRPGLWVSTLGPGTKKYPASCWIDQEDFLFENGNKLFHSSALNIPGKHNLQNLLMVTKAAREIGLSPKEIESAIKSFKGVPHRLERLGEFKGITVFNDSKATNYDSACMAIKAVPSPSIVLAGGEIKKGDASAWLIQLHQKACGIVLFGKNANELIDLIKASGYSGDVRCSKSLDQAVNQAVEIGLNNNAKSLLLSPACASFDQYKDFEERGDHFRKLIAPILER